MASSRHHSQDCALGVLPFPKGTVTSIQPDTKEAPCAPAPWHTFIHASFASNSSGNYRNGIITVTAGEASSEIWIGQAPQRSDGLPGYSESEVSSWGGTESFDFYGYGDKSDIHVESSAPSWLQVELGEDDIWTFMDTSLHLANVKVTSEPNLTDTTRYAIITITFGEPGDLYTINRLVSQEPSY